MLANGVRNKGILCRHGLRLYVLMQTFPTFLTNRKSCADHSTTVWSFSRLCFHVNVCKRIRIFHRLDCGDGLQIIVFLMYSDIKCSYTHKIFKGAEMRRQIILYSTSARGITLLLLDYKQNFPMVDMRPRS